MPDFAHPGWFALLLVIPCLWLARTRWGVPEGAARRRLGTMLRCLALGALVLAIAGPLAKHYSRNLQVIFALDLSSSIDPDVAQEALAFVNRAFTTKPTDTEMGLVVFAANAAVEAMLRETPAAIVDVHSDVDRGGTNLGAGLERAIGTFKPTGHRRLVLLSDGQENSGEALPVASAARAVGVEISTVALSASSHRDEVRVEGLTAPNWVRAHEPFTAQVAVHSNKRTSAKLLTMRNGLPIAETEVELSPGANTFSVIDQVADNGLYEYEVILSSEADSQRENNRYQTFVQVRGLPRVLHASADTADERYLSDALRAQGLQVEDVLATNVPGKLHDLAAYDLVILNNVSGFDLSGPKMDLLEEYVRDLGGGVISLGGHKAYGAGGYYATPIERLLPVDMDSKTEVIIPISAVNVLIDKSGSMSSAVGGKQKLAIAKRAALSAIEVLNPLDHIGVLAFDSTYEWTVEPTEAGDRQSIVEKLNQMGGGGGTDLFAALSEAHRVTREQQAKVKHLIVLSDGLTETPGDFEQLSRAIADDAISISTVAFGTDADQTLMQAIAAIGGGRYYYASDPENIPRIFTSETLMISRDLFVEEDIAPKLVNTDEILKGLGDNALPIIKGYQRTFLKPAARLLLAANGDDPLLASWRYGLGKSVAFTSDLANRWGQHWVAWDQFSRFAAQLARWTMRRSAGESLIPTFRWQGQRGEMLVDALDRNDQFINGLNLTAEVVDAQRNNVNVTLKQIAPGRYRGEFPIQADGRYYVKLSGKHEDVQVGPKVFGLAVPYSQEYLGLGANKPLLTALAEQTGGAVLSLSPASLRQVTTVNDAAARSEAQIWWPWLLLALSFLVLEVAVRKVNPPASWRERWEQGQDTHADRPEEITFDALQAKISQARAERLRAYVHGRGSFGENSG